jgi:hypothetical protein
LGKKNIEYFNIALDSNLLFYIDKVDPHVAFRDSKDDFLESLLIFFLDGSDDLVESD